jgi:hypothetical protein
VVASLIRTPRVLVSVICEGRETLPVTLEVSGMLSLIMAWSLS